MPECIHCSKPPDSPEHWLPRSLGTFGPLQVLHDKICDDCNQALGREIDPEFARVGPEAILRAGLGGEGRRGPSKSPFYYKAATEQPLRAVVPEAPEDEAGLLWETVPGSSGDPEGRLLQQLVIVDGSEKRHVIPFNIEWSADVLRKAVQHRGIEGGKLTEIYLDPEHLDRAKPILSEYRNDRIIAGLGDGFMLKDWGHVVAVETTETTVFTKLQFFIGPGSIPPIWVVRIGRRPDHAPANTGVAYYARYLEAPSPDGHTGEMIPLDQAPRA